jgi:hypothetical protein
VRAYATIKSFLHHINLNSQIPLVGIAQHAGFSPLYTGAIQSIGEHSWLIPVWLDTSWPAGDLGKVTTCLIDHTEVVPEDEESEVGAVMEGAHFTEADRKHMRRALELASRALGECVSLPTLSNFYPIHCVL